MPSYLYRRGLAPRGKKETLEEVKARIRKEIEERTEERVRYWISLAEWCYSKPGPSSSGQIFVVVGRFL